MIRQKRGFLTFIFSLMPGAGEMYMGLFKQGISIMLLALGIAAFSSISGFSVMLILGVVVWFYSFFHVHNLASMQPEQFQLVEDHFLFTENDEQLKKVMQSQKARKVFAIALIVIGVSSLWDVLTDLLGQILPVSASDAVWSFSHAVPQSIIAVLIIYLGVVLIRGKKKELDDMQEDPTPMENSNVVIDSVVVEEKVNSAEEVKS